MQLCQLIPNDSLELLRGLTLHVGEHLPDPEILAAQAFINALLSYHQGITNGTQRFAMEGERNLELGMCVSGGESG